MKAFLSILEYRELLNKLTFDLNDVCQVSIPLMSPDKWEANRAEGQRLYDSRQWEQALPYFLAALPYDPAAASLFLLAQCCYFIVMDAAAGGTLARTHGMYVNSAINLLSEYVRSPIEEGGAYELRSDMYVIKAQMERDSSAVDQAETDMNDAIRIGSRNPSNIETRREKLENIRRLKALL
jgi:hypothetical protein